MQIAICEDDQLYIDGISRACKEWQQIHNCTTLTIKQFNTPESLLDYWEKRGRRQIDLFFLDIEFTYMNGFDLAKEIRQTDTVTPIVFVTNSKNYMLAGYELSIYRYLVKPVQNDAIFNCLDHAFSILNSSAQDSVILDKTGGVIRVPIKDILYLSYGLHSVIIHKTTRGELVSTLYESFDQFSSSLPANHFVRCHRGYIVNLQYICQYTRTKLYLINDEEIPIGKNYQDNALDTIHKYFLGEII